MLTIESAQDLCEHLTGEIGRLREVAGGTLVDDQLGNSEALVNNILDSLNVEVAVLDRTGTIIKAHDFLLNFAPENGDCQAAPSTGANFLELCRRAQAAGDEMASKAIQAIEAVLQGERGQSSLEYPHTSPESARWFLIRVTPLESSHGGVVLANYEITERKATQGALQKADGELERLKNKTLAENVYRGWTRAAGSPGSVSCFAAQSAKLSPKG